MYKTDEVRTYISKRCPEVGCFSILERVVFQIFLWKEKKRGKKGLSVSCWKTCIDINQKD